MHALEYLPAIRYHWADYHTRLEDLNNSICCIDQGLVNLPQPNEDLPSIVVASERAIHSARAVHSSHAALVTKVQRHLSIRRVFDASAGLLLM